MEKEGILLFHVRLYLKGDILPAFSYITMCWASSKKAKLPNPTKSIWAAFTAYILPLVFCSTTVNNSREHPDPPALLYYHLNLLFINVLQPNFIRKRGLISLQFWWTAGMYEEAEVTSWSGSQKEIGTTIPSKAHTWRWNDLPQGLPLTCPTFQNHLRPSCQA